MKTQLRHALNAGITFGIITIFLFLIGFTSIAADLLGDLLRNKNAELFLGLSPQMLNMLIFLGLVGLAAGAYGSRKIKGRANDPWGPALMGGLTAGLVHAILVGSLALLVGTLNQRGVQISKYLAEVLPAAIKLFLLGKAPLPGAVFHLVFLTLTGLAGGLLSSRHWTWQLESPEWDEVEECLESIDPETLH